MQLDLRGAVQSGLRQQGYIGPDHVLHGWRYSRWALSIIPLPSWTLNPRS